jgi:hypothetical protein
MAKQEQTVSNLNKNKSIPDVKTDLVNILIGMVVMILFIAGLVYLIGALLR